MNDQTSPYAPNLGRWARTSNMALAASTMASAINASEGVPRMVLFYGPSGYGKTIACSHVAAVTDAAYVLARSVWTAKTFLEALAREVGITLVKKTASEIMDQIVDAITQRPCPIIIDEMDHLVKKQSVDMIRDIYDATSMPIMMVGEENLPSKLKEWDRFDNRILRAEAAAPSTLEDGRLLRDLYVRTVKMDDDLVDLFTAECGGVTRRIVANLQEAQRIAIDDLGVMQINRNDWGNRAIMTGKLPGPRKIQGFGL
jgi:SpoVK/Ycf46/Vps4 family AAA+-type ATPase